MTSTKSNAPWKKSRERAAPKATKAKTTESARGRGIVQDFQQVGWLLVAVAAVVAMAMAVAVAMAMAVAVVMRNRCCRLPVTRPVKTRSKRQRQERGWWHSRSNRYTSICCCVHCIVASLPCRPCPATLVAVAVAVHGKQQSKLQPALAGGVMLLDTALDSVSSPRAVHQMRCTLYCKEEHN